MANFGRGFARGFERAFRGGEAVVAGMEAGRKARVLEQEEKEKRDRLARMVKNLRSLESQTEQGNIANAGTSLASFLSGAEDIEEAKNHLKKAEHNFKAVLSFEKTGFSDWSVSAVFYTIYHCFLAIIRKFGYESRNQECTIALVEHLKEQNKIKLKELGF